MSLDNNALTTLVKLKARFNIVDDNYDIALEEWINSASTDIQRRMGRELVYATYTSQKLSGHGQSFLVLPAWPIWEITSLVENDITLVEDTDYVIFGIEKRYLRKIVDGLSSDNNLVWAKGINNIVATYKAGYWVADDPAEGNGATEMPKDIQTAGAIQSVIDWHKALGEDWEVISKAFGDGSTTRNVDDLQKRVEEIIRSYRGPVL